jgi:hypothetical protein
MNVRSIAERLKGALVVVLFEATEQTHQFGLFFSHARSETAEIKADSDDYRPPNQTLFA